MGAENLKPGGNIGMAQNLPVETSGARICLWSQEKEAADAGLMVADFSSIRNAEMEQFFKTTEISTKLQATPEAEHAIIDPAEEGPCCIPAGQAHEKYRL